LNRRHWWLPSLTQCIWLVFFLGLLLTHWRQVLVNADGDPCWHWQTGNWILEHHAILRNDPFSHTCALAPMTSKEWLSEVIFAMAGKALGWNGIVLIAALLIATALALLHRQLLAEGSDVLIATLLVLLAARTCATHWLARPHLYTLLLVVIFAWQLRWFDRDRVRPWQLFARLVPLAVLWANLHGGFLSGLALIGIHLFGNAVRWFADDAAARATARRRVTTLLILGSACGLATLVNPNGWRLHEHIFDFLRTPYQAFFTNEWTSVNFHSGGMDGLLLQLLLLGVLLITLRRSLSVTDLGLVAFWLYAGLLAVRNVPIFALIVTPILAEHFSAAVSDARPLLWTRPFRRLSADIAALNRRAGHITLPLLAVALMLLIFSKPALLGGQPLIDTTAMTNRFPVAAANYLRNHPQIVHGEMFNDYAWGGYLILYFPERKVFIDGRNDFYPPSFLHDFSAVNHLAPSWESVLAKYHIGWTILPRDHPLNQLLALHKNWRLAYADDVALIYSRLQPSEALTESHPDRSRTSSTSHTASSG